ncbi:Fur family transcriptional regulator [Desulforamulus aquiferis]|uniref:Transcriptional repressor n=1 Tax=Desulforamulus aquiferis TaxID=1397668 RepID=A0AAW7ZFI2_9FIRM|nr:transcriptional repressor [Desulforamulus aquiferis]MDO7788023.1 transcriptional repressor [Desulforamulus aquiferis]RYD04685.1 Fur family transcriptional regulator [Desulforamulus aquiferis]
MKKVISEIGEKLRSNEYKLTPQRQQILEVLLENKDKHLSAEDVYNLVKQKSPDVGLATVYRTLELFLEFDIIHSVNFGDGRKRYEYGENSDGHHHHHAICLKCGKILEINEDLLEELERQVAEQYRFTITDHELKIFGYCEGCKVNAK